MADQLVSQPTFMPTRKVAMGGGASAATIILVWVLGLVGLNIPPEVASAITTLFGLGVGWLVRDTAQ